MLWWRVSLLGIDPQATTCSRVPCQLDLNSGILSSSDQKWSMWVFFMFQQPFCLISAGLIEKPWLGFKRANLGYEVAWYIALPTGPYLFHQAPALWYLFRFAHYQMYLWSMILGVFLFCQIKSVSSVGHGKSIFLLSCLREPRPTHEQRSINDKW